MRRQIDEERQTDTHRHTDSDTDSHTHTRTHAPLLSHLPSTFLSVPLSLFFYLFLPLSFALVFLFFLFIFPHFSSFSCAADRSCVAASPSISPPAPREPPPDEVTPPPPPPPPPFAPVPSAHARKNYIGVSFCKTMQKWRARLFLKSKRVNLGSHATEIAAAQAYDQEARKYADKSLNFPIGSEEAARRGAQCLLLRYLFCGFLMAQLCRLYSVAHVADVAVR
jgi:hypothetical protein